MIAFSGGMGQGACSGYLKRDVSLVKPSCVMDDQNNNLTKMAEIRKIKELEEKLQQKENEIAAYQVSLFVLDRHT